MKVVKSGLILSFIIGFVLTGLIYGQGQINLSQTSKMSELPFVICLLDGRVMVVWTEGHFNAGGVLWYRIWSAGAGWSAAQVAVPRKGASAFAQLDLDSKGNVHMAYMDGNSSYNREIYYAKFSGGSWSAPEMVYYSPGLNSSWPRIDVEGNRIYVLWCHNYTPPRDDIRQQMDIYLNEKVDGGTWPSSVQNVSKLSGGVSVHPFFDAKNGNIYAAWMDDIHLKDNWNIYFNQRVNGYWGNSVRLNPDWNQYIPGVAVDDQENVHVIYSNKGNPVWYMKKTGNTWSEAVTISTARTTVTSMNFLKYSHGLLHGLWRQREGSGNYIYYGRGTPAGQWEDPIKVSHGGESEYPALDVDRSGQVHVVYSDIGVGGDRDVFYVRVDQVTSYPVPSFSAAPTQGNPPLQVAFDASSSYDPDGQIVSYKWDFGDGNKASGVQYIHTYTKKGIHNAVLTVTDDEDQSSSASQQIVVGTPPVAKFTATPNSGSSPLNVRFDASTSYDPDGNIVSYSWNFGDGTSGQGKVVTHTYTNNGIRNATLTVKDNEGLTATASTEIKVSSGAIALIKSNRKQGPAPLTVEFDASNSKPADRAGGKIVSYVWDFDDGSTAQGPKVTHTFRKTGLFTVTMEVTDNQGYKDSNTKDVIVFAKPVAQFTCSPTSGIAPLEVFFNASGSSDSDGRITSFKWTFGDGTTGFGKTIKHTYTKGGTMTATLTVTDDDGWTDTASETIEVIEKPYPPQGVSVKNVAIEGLFFSEYMNILEWKKNPKNTGKIQVVSYMILKRYKDSGSKDFIYQATVGPDVFKWEDTSLKSKADMLNCYYGIRAVDAFGRESDTRKIDAAKGETAANIENPKMPEREELIKKSPR